MKDLIQERLQNYGAQTDEDEENALKEITQEMVLYGLAESGFFEKAVFHGGTCLRIVHGLDRFSEDLDFALRSPNDAFDLDQYLHHVSNTMKVYGYGIEVMGADKDHKNVQSRFLKDDSIKKILKFSHRQESRKKIQIKIELDTHPPSGDKVEANYLDFPMQFMIITHDRPSLLAGKIHALLSRNFVKGRDWYDFLWYISKKTRPNLELLQNALNQAGPWKNQMSNIENDWIQNQLNQKIKSINWEEAKKDVEKFLRPEKKKTLDLWSADFFLKMTEKLFASLGQ